MNTAVEMRDLGTFKTTDRCAEVFACIEVKEHVPRAVMAGGRIEYECVVCGIKWAVEDGEDEG